MNTELETLSSREQFLLARGDVAIVTLQALLAVISPMAQTNRTLQQELNKILAKQAQTGTLLNIVADVTNANVETLNSVETQVADVLKEVEAFTSNSGMELNVDTAVANVVNTVRQCSSSYSSMSDEEIKKLMGL